MKVLASFYLLGIKACKTEPYWRTASTKEEGGGNAGRESEEEACGCKDFENDSRACLRLTVLVIALMEE